MKPAAGAVLDVEHKVADSIGAVAHKSAACWAIVIHVDGGSIDPVLSETIKIDASEIVIAHGGYDPNGLPKFCSLVRKYCGGTRGERTGQRLRDVEPFADGVGRDFDQDFPDDYDLFHRRPTWVLLLSASTSD